MPILNHRTQFERGNVVRHGNKEYIVTDRTYDGWYILVKWSGKRAPFSFVSPTQLSLVREDCGKSPRWWDRIYWSHLDFSKITPEAENG